MKKILHILLNKYLITTAAFVVWMVFFDSNSVTNQLKLKEKLHDLNSEKNFYLDNIHNDSILTQKLLNDSTELERFAREKFLMKRDNEDVYIVIDTSSNSNSNSPSTSSTADQHQ